jgi:hypothetical protein
MTNAAPSAADRRGTEAYVRAALALQGYEFSAAQTAAIAEQFARIEAMAATFRHLPLPREQDAAPAFRP